MIKLLTGTVIGVFLGAFAFEVLSKKFPETMSRIESKTSEYGEIIANSFIEQGDDLDDIIRE